MEKLIDGFVGIYKNAFPKEYCQDVIKQFNRLQEQGFTKTRQETNDGTKLVKDDTAIWSGNYIEEASGQGFHTLIGQKFSEVFWEECYAHYVEHFAVINDIREHGVWGNKVQRTNVGQGYHVWHCEHNSFDASRRILFYVLYLNDVEDGGETEFLYQSKRYKAEEGTLILAPASFTHAHRGNPPLTNDKYIMTGWVEF